MGDQLASKSTGVEGKPTCKSPTHHDRYILLQRKFEDLLKLRSEEEKAHQVKLVTMKQDLTRAQKSVTDYTERLYKQKKVVSALETKVQELKKSSLADQAEIKDLRVKLRMSEYERAHMNTKRGDLAETKKALQMVDTRRREENRDRDKRIADLEKTLGQEKKRRELAEAQCHELKGKGDVENQVLRQQASLLREEVHQIQAKLESQLEESILREEGLVSQLEQHRDMLSRVAEEYSRLASSSVAASLFVQVRNEKDAQQMRVSRLERKLANSEEQVTELARLIRCVKAENELRAQQVHQAQETISYYQSVLHDTSISVHHQADDLIDAYMALDRELLADRQRIKAITDRDNALTLEFYFSTYHDLLLDYTLTEEHSRNQERICAQLENDVDRTSTECDELRSQLTHTDAKRLEIEAEVKAISAALIEAQMRKKDLETQLTEAEYELRDQASVHRAALAKEQETVHRLTSSLQRATTVEDGLRAEIEQLTTELNDAERYQEAYYSLSDEVGSLVARNALAEEEAARLRQFNAEILGHNNPAQRIMYVDRIRRDLADTKQKLLISNCEQEAITRENTALRQELSMYKSVIMPVDHKPRTNLTRIARQPLSNLPQNPAVTRGGPFKTQDMSVQKLLAEHLPSLEIGDMTLDELPLKDPLNVSESRF